MAELAFKVPTMSCGRCVQSITNEIRKLDRNYAVEIDLHSKWVVVTGAHIDTDAIRGAVEAAGYRSEL